MEHPEKESSGAEAFTREKQLKITPQEALAILKKGNDRFVQGAMSERDLISQVMVTARGQFPFAAILGCIDSRVPPEIIFDQGIGDIFSLRIAGNFANTDILGSLEFATKIAGARLVVVKGHTSCGAIAGACDGVELGHLTATLRNLTPAINAVRCDYEVCDSSNREFVNAVARANVRLTVEGILNRSLVIRDLVDTGQVLVVGAMLDVETGRVEFFDPAE